VLSPRKHRSAFDFVVIPAQAGIHCFRNDQIGFRVHRWCCRRWPGV